MELVHAPVAELRALLTESFEEWAGATGATGVLGATGAGRTCAISGDAPALIFLPALRAAAVDWSKITLFWTDEHAVPADDPESNYGIAERMLLSPLGAKAPWAVRIRGEMPDLDQAAATYDNELETALGDAGLDLAILGVGEDGHICALFPGNPSTQIEAEPRSSLRVVAVNDAPRPPVRRLSLTLPFLLRTQQIWLLAVGPRKLPVLQAALAKTQRSTPLDLLLQQAKDVTVFTDQVIRRR
jgi:6-phosphogluconolactonase